jgi:hypothetical protein
LLNGKQAVNSRSSFWGGFFALCGRRYRVAADAFVRPAKGKSEDMHIKEQSLCIRRRLLACETAFSAWPLIMDKDRVDINETEKPHFSPRTREMGHPGTYQTHEPSARFLAGLSGFLEL